MLGKAARDRGMATLLDDGIAKVEQGLTTPQEALRAARL
jgi:type II secretory ATPase GspE/PulE/Tfp pilus assembly ATPase PilB-like protein